MSFLDIIIGLVILSSGGGANLPKIIVIIVCLFLLQKGAFSLVSWDKYFLLIKFLKVFICLFFMKKRIPEGYTTERKFSRKDDLIKVYDLKRECIGSVVLSEDGKELTPYEMIEGIHRVIEQYES